MQGKPCPHCEIAQARSLRGAVPLYPIWNVHCDDCCRRVLAFYPEHHISSMNMALIVGMKRGFPFVTALQREIRHEQLKREASLQAAA